MRRRLAHTFALLALAAAAAPAGAAEIVVFDDPDRTVRAETAERERDLGFDAQRRFSRAVKGFAADLTPEQERELRADPEVAFVVPDRPVRKMAEVPAQPGGIIPPGVRRVLQAPPSTVREAATPAVAVLDTGVDLEHPDLDVVAGTTCAGSGPPDDVDGHGTHVAGTIGAKNDGSGVAGVAPGTKIVAVKVLNDEGWGTTSTVLCGIDWVLSHRAELDIKVVNLSLGGAGDRSSCNGDPEHLAYCQLAAAGVVPVVAAGNDGWNFGGQPPDIPASYPEVLTVAAMADTDGVAGASGPAACSALEADDRFASFSNFAALEADAAHLVAAPGVCIRSTKPGGGTQLMSGTSMAAPHVAGLVALCHGEAGETGPCSGLTTAEVIEHMVQIAGAATGTAFTPDLSNPAGLYGPFAVLPRDEPAAQPPAEEEPPAGDDAPPETPAEAAGETTVLPPPAAPAATTAQAPPPAVAFPAPGQAAKPRAATASDARLTLTGIGMRRFRNGGLTARVTCPSGCRATVRVTAKRASRGVPAELVRPTAPRSGAIRLKVTPVARRALRRARRLVVVVSAEVTTPRGVVTVERTIALR